MSATMRPAKRNSLPSLGLGFNKFFVSKRASMFENQEETPQEKRDRSPCGVLETSERKMQGSDKAGTLRGHCGNIAVTLRGHCGDIDSDLR